MGSRSFFVLLAFGLMQTTVSANTGPIEKCEPSVGTSGKSDVHEIAGTRSEGKAALEEMDTRGNLSIHRDRLGRKMFSDSNALLETIDGSTPENTAKGIYPMARIERYCSKKTDNTDAACVDLCVRWTTYERF